MMNDVCLNFRDGKKIFDSVHGTIHLTEDEITIINTPQFQRLRKINQLGFASYVFPEANHTRFSHSLGVLAVMNRLCQHLLINDDERCLLRLTALLHDVGHFPFSHTLEEVYEQERIDVINLRSKKDFLADKRGEHSYDDGTETKRSNHKYNYRYHEECSSIIARQILKSCVPNLDKKNAVTLLTLSLVTA